MSSYLLFRINDLQCDLMLRLRALLLPFLSVLCACSTALQTIPKPWMSVPEAARIRSVALAPDGKVTTSPDTPPAKPAKFPLSDTLAAVESFDISEARGEIVFAAKKTSADGFDIGLVATDGSAMNWVPSDPADEVAVQWAPRGNKISYVVRAKAGDVVRTVHVPTAFQQTIEFPSARVHALAWEPAAERFAIAYSTPEASDRVEVMKYNGEGRRVAVKPGITVDAEVEPFGPEAITVRRRDVRYGEKLPLVVWIDDDLYAWNDARGALLRDARVALIVTRKAPDEELWRRAAALPWIDAERRFVVGAEAPGAVSILADAAVPRGRSRRDGGAVAVSPAVVQSFAAAFIADQIRRTGPTNGFSR